MLFNSVEFLFVFLPVVLLIFLFLQRVGTQRVVLAWLVISSVFFYGWWNPRYLLLIGFSISINYLIGRVLSDLRGRQRTSALRRTLIGGVALNLALIAYFKYAKFFADTFSQVAGISWEMSAIVLPIGISFFTFQQIAYLVDTKQGKIDEHGFLQYSVFVLFFPQLIAGPIVHHREMLPQFNLIGNGNSRVYKNLAFGITYFSVGLFKKMFIADGLAEVASPVFDAAARGEVLDFFAAWRGTISYTLQLYFDFSGYSDMAIGLGRMFGIRLPVNFMSPYRATSIIEFWKCWHITLSRFLRNYVYIPLGGNRHGEFRRFISLFATMLLGGLWHGANWTFVVWGGLHGLLLMINHAWRGCCRLPSGQWWTRLGARLTTFFVVAASWVIFRAENLDAAAGVFDGMRNLPFSITTHIGPFAQVLTSIGFRFDGPWVGIQDIYSLLWLVFWLAVLWLVPNTQEWMRESEQNKVEESETLTIDAKQYGAKNRGWRHWSISGRWAFYVGILISLSLLSISRVSEFLYFQF